MTLMRVINTLENPSIKAVFYKQPRRFFKVVFVQFVNNKHQRIMIKCGKLKVMLVACDIVTLTKYIIYINTAWTENLQCALIFQDWDVVYSYNHTLGKRNSLNFEHLIRRNQTIFLEILHFPLTCLDLRGSWLALCQLTTVTVSRAFWLIFLRMRLEEWRTGYIGLGNMAEGIRF